MRCTTLTGNLVLSPIFYSIHYIAKIIKDKHEKVCDGKQMVVEKFNQTMKCEAGKCKMERIVEDFQLPDGQYYLY